MMMSWLSLLCCLAYSSSFGSAKHEAIANKNLVSHKQPLTSTKASLTPSHFSTRPEATQEPGLGIEDSLPQSILVAQSPSPSITQGQEIAINGRKFPVAWSQWQEGTSVRTGISDTGAMKTLGLELLSTSNPSAQPVAWFSSDSSPPLLLKARFVAPYRYLDITDLVPADGLQVLGNTLSINTVPAQIFNIRVGKQAWGQRIVLDLNRPTFWQTTQTKGEGSLTLEGTASQALLDQFQPSLEDPKSPYPIELDSSATTTKLRLNLPEDKRMQVFSLSEPDRLVIDIRSEPLDEREIVWAQGIRWLEQSITIISSEGTKDSPTKQFPVIWLEIDPRSNLSLKPITSRPDTQVGIAPLLDTARLSQAAAAINGGFFNRDNQLPLGAIRQDGRWLSGPILNRGAIAWGNGTVKIGRLSLQEVLITSSHRLPVLFLNSGYVEAGLARYTPEWGLTYSPLTDNETVFIVQNNRVTQLETDVSKEDSVPIPADGYLLTLRATDLPPSALAINTQVSLDAILPADFTDYPQIIGAGPLLLENRQIVLDAAMEQFSPAFYRQAASRSAIGVTEQGTLVIAAVHSGSTGKGPTLGELAQIMQRLGAIDALNLDGGSSTALYLGGQIIDRPQNSAARVHNGLGIFVQ